MQSSAISLFFCLLCIFFSVSPLLAKEKIYAIMVTGKDSFHYKLAMRSIESFLQQTYSNKELVIINDGNYNFDHIKDSRIREVHSTRKLPLGALRNLGLRSIPRDAIWMQWDDDDYRHPNLMEEQYARLTASSADLCYLRAQIRYCFAINSAWVYRGKLWEQSCVEKKLI